MTLPVGSVETAEPAVYSGASGVKYDTLAQAIAAEQEDANTLIAPAVGTASGVVVGPNDHTLSNVDDAYKDYWMINESVAPSNGLACRYARVSKYIGATHVFTLDAPWDFSAETVLRLVRPVRVSLTRDITEDLILTKNVELNLGGHRLRGKIDQTSGSMLLVRYGWVTNGVQKTNLGLLRLDDVSVSRRDETIYAVLLTDGSNYGRCEMVDCKLGGRVAGRRGFAGWRVQNCVSRGVANNASFDNVPYALVESITAVSVVVSALDVEVDSEMGGAFLYSENSITGATAYLSFKGQIRAPHDFFLAEPSAGNFHLARARATGVLTVTQTLGRTSLVMEGFRQDGTAIKTQPFCGVACADGLSGSLTYNAGPAGLAVQLNIPDTSVFNFVTVEGAVDTTGSVTLGGTAGYNITGQMSLSHIRLQARVAGTGSISVNAGATVVTGGTVVVLNIQVNQNSGTPSFTVASQINHRAGVLGTLFTFAAGVLVTTGTWTVSGVLSSWDESQTFSNTLVAGVSGGTWVLSTIQTVNLSRSIAIQSTVAVIQHSGTGGSVTWSGGVLLQGGRIGSFTVANATGAGATVAFSGSVDIRHVDFNSNVFLVQAITSTSTVTYTSSQTIFGHCSLPSDVFIMNSQVVGASVSITVAPAFDHCRFNSELRDRSAGGVGTYSMTGSLTLRKCNVQRTFTFTGPQFSVICDDTTFEAAGGVVGTSIQGLGTRPTAYSLRSCTFFGFYSDLQPDVLDVYEVLPSSAAMSPAGGRLVTINASAKVADGTAARVVKGVLFTSATGADQAVVIVTKGRLKVKSNAAVALGDETIQEAGTPTQQIAGVAAIGKVVGVALEAAAAGLAYTAIDIH